MALKIHSTYFIVVILFSVAHNRKVKRSSPDFTDIVKNISSVNSLLQNVIRNYKELEKIAKSDTEEKDFRTDSEIKKLFKFETSKNLEHIITTKSDKLVGTPIFYSEESWQDGDSDTIEKSETDKENYETALKDSKELSKPSAMKKKHAKVRNFKDDAESNGDKKSDEISQHEPRVKTPRNKDYKKNIVVMKKASKLERNGSFKSKPQRVPPVNIKILQTTKAVHDSNSDDEKVMMNEVLRADYLREAYVDACKMVTIRKCRKALRAVSKDVCSRGRKCTQKFKDDFRQNGMSACDSQFNNRTACRSGVDYDDTEVHLADKRLLNVMMKTKEPGANSSKHAKAIARTQQMNVLRDRYEKACKKESLKNCEAACKYSYTKTCKKFECAKAKNNLFKKSCKRRCKESFGVTGGDGDDSDDSGSSGGSGGSGGGSGSGSGS